MSIREVHFCDNKNCSKWNKEKKHGAEFDPKKGITNLFWDVDCIRGTAECSDIEDSIHYGICPECAIIMLHEFLKETKNKKYIVGLCGQKVEHTHIPEKD